MSDTRTPDPQYLEQVMSKALMMDKDYIVSVTTVFEEDYFDSPAVKDIFSFTKEYFHAHSEIPDVELMVNSLPEDRRDAVRNYISEVNSMDINLPRCRDWLMEHTDIFLKDKAIKAAIVESVDIIEEGRNSHDIRQVVEEALCKTLDINLGLDYFGQMGPRLHRMMTDETQRLPTYFPQFDEFINGGFPPKTLSVFVAKIHGFKSNVMANMIARQVMAGHDICLASLEMSEDMFAQRFDGIYSQLDLNRFYFNQRLQRELMTKLRQIKRIEGRGNLYIKAFPTGKATVNDFRMWLRELKMRGANPSAFFFDYLNLMQSAEVGKGNSTYESVKSVAEETRAMGFDFDIPMISVSQLNRSGTFMSFEDVDFNSIAESIGVPATADFMMIMGANDEHMVYQNEVHYKIVKNRLGGRVGEMDKFYYDGRSLKMYCSSELDTWMHDVESSGDDRFPHQQLGERQ